MSNKTIGLSDDLHAYLLGVSLREPDVMRRLRAATASHPDGSMQSAPEQVQFMQWLVRLIGARRALEIGVFTGYSALGVALALPDDGRLVACDVSEAYTRQAVPYWEEAGVAGKIDLRIAPAADTLDALLAGGEAGTFDFAYIDADKTGYDGYYERCLALLRPGGVIVLDNMLRGGRVLNTAPDDEDTRAIDRLSHKLKRDERIDQCLVPLADGVTLVRKR